MNDNQNNDFHRIQNHADIVEIIKSYIEDQTDDIEKTFKTIN